MTDTDTTDLTEAQPEPQAGEELPEALAAEALEEDGSSEDADEAEEDGDELRLEEAEDDDQGDGEP